MTFKPATKENIQRISSQRPSIIVFSVPGFLHPENDQLFVPVLDSSNLGELDVLSEEDLKEVIKPFT